MTPETPVKMVHCRTGVSGSLRRFPVADGPTDDLDAPALTQAALRHCVTVLGLPTVTTSPSLGFVDDKRDVCVLRTKRDLREALAVSPALLRPRAGPADST